MFLIILLLFLKGQNAEIIPKILGGDYISIGKSPHAVFLYMETKEFVGICGSSILNQNILLSAAHCFAEFKKIKWDITALAGSEQLDKVTVLRDVTRFLYHQHYNLSTVASNDIALAYLKKPLPLGDKIKRIIIQPNFNAQYGEIAGWGNQREDGPTTEPNKLKMVRQQIFSQKYCKRIQKIGVGAFCAGSVVKTKLQRPDVGDSGSGLVTDDNIQIGIVSFLDRRQPHIVVYTNVSYHYDWIKHNSLRIYCV